MMTDDVKRIVDALRTCHSNEDCRDCKYIESDKDEMSCVNMLFVEAACLIESLSAELEQVENKLSELLYYTTGGRYSKAEYSTDDMRRFVDDYFQSVCSECDELEQVELERDAAVQDLNACCPCEVCTWSCTYDKVNAYDECADFQWRGPGGMER